VISAVSSMEKICAVSSTFKNQKHRVSVSNTPVCDLLELDNIKFWNYVWMDLDVLFKFSFCFYCNNDDTRTQAHCILTCHAVLY